MVVMRENFVAVESLHKAHKKEHFGDLVMPETVDNTGIVRFVSGNVAGIEVGDKVYFGAQREQIRMEGKDILIMKEDNVFAVIANEEKAEN